MTLAARERGTARLEQAVAAYDAALGEHNRDRLPLDWALTAGNQATALLALAERTSNLALARRALDQLTAAEALLRAAAHLPYADHYEAELPAAQALVARLSAP